MNFRIFALLLLLFVLSGNAMASDKLYFYLECSQWPKCVDFYNDGGRREWVQAEPVMDLAKADVEWAKAEIGFPNTRLNITLSKDAARKVKKILSPDIYKRIRIVFDNKILAAPMLYAPTMYGREFVILDFSKRSPFWEKISWLQDIIQGSSQQGTKELDKLDARRQVLIYLIIALAVSIAAFVYAFLPRARRKSFSRQE